MPFQFQALMVVIAVALPTLVAAGAVAGPAATIEINIFRLVGGGPVPSLVWIYSGPTAAGVNGPATIQVPLGTLVTWKNRDISAVHTVTNGLAPGVGLPPVVTGLLDEVKLSTFGSPSMGGGDTYSWHFTEPGAYPYYCAIGGAAGHHLNGMHGVIEVIEVKA